MNCPACDRDLSARTLDNVTVDVCDGGCGGIWLDAFELARVDEELPREIRDIAKNPKLVIDDDRKRPCPRCDGIKMQRHFYSSAHRVEVDSCQVVEVIGSMLVSCQRFERTLRSRIRPMDPSASI